MSAVVIGWEYLTGYAIAADPGARDRAEWPPHPARVFMALAAAWFESDPVAAGPASHAEKMQWQEEGDALRWLETLGDPELCLPPESDVFERSLTTTYVPVNDKAGPASAIVQSAPAVTRSRQPRTFPRVWVGDSVCYALWSVGAHPKHSAALERLCGKVTRIGHSSSLVRMWLADNVETSGTSASAWTPDNLDPAFRVRSLSGGMLEMLAERFNDQPRREHAALAQRIAALEAKRRLLKGRSAAGERTAIGAEMEAAQGRRAAIDPRPPLRPTFGVWSGYRQRTHPVRRAHSHFDTDLLVLSHVDGPRLGAASTIQVTQALRATLMSGSEVQPVPAWVSGHGSSGEPLCAEDGHLACVALPHVGGLHADGHLMGVALVFPRSVSRQDRAEALAPVVLTSNGEPRRVGLRLGALGVWTVLKRDWMDARVALQDETWTALRSGTCAWASVTPVVLDRFPKADVARDREAWQNEVAGIVREGCRRIGLPAPVHVDVDSTSWHRGSPRAVVKRRRLRDGSVTQQDARASLGDGFPAFPARGTNGPRPQVHVWLEFGEPVTGPVVLGAGRYMGYGLCKPLMASGGDRR